MKRQLGVISKVDAIAISPDFVRFAGGDWNALGQFIGSIMDLKKGAFVLVKHVKNKDQFSIAKITKVDMTRDDPIYRVSDGEWSWRSEIVFPITRGKEHE